MRVKSRQVAVGAVAVICFGLGTALIAFKWVSGDDDVSVEFASEPPVALASGMALAGVFHGRKEGSLSLDGQRRLIPNEKVEISSAGLTPGLHVARLRTSSDAKTQQGKPLWDRTVAMGFLQGPFDDPAAWQSCAARLHVGQAFLEDFVDRVASQRLIAALAGQPHVPPVLNTLVELKWANDGIDALAHINFSTETDLGLRGHVRVWVDDKHELHLVRIGSVDVTGSQVEAWQDEGRREGVRQAAARGAALGSQYLGSLGERLGAYLGVVIGGRKGAQIGASIADEEAHEKVTTVVDEQGLEVLEQMLRLPPAMEVKNGLKVQVRYCRDLRVESGREASVGFDIQTEMSVKRQLTTPGPISRASVAPPLAMEPPPALTLDISPALLDGFLDSWWRSGRLTDLMNERRWLQTVNSAADAGLDFQIEHVEPLLPPSLEMVAGEPMVRVAETKLTLTSKSQAKPRDARVFADVKVTPRFVEAKQEFAFDWQFSELAITCHDPDPATGHVFLRPCYADLLSMVNEGAFALPNPNVTLTLSFPLHHLLFKGGGKRRLPFELSHITPSVLDSQGAPWVRVSADVSL